MKMRECLCDDCGEDTFRLEYYMVKFELWELAIQNKPVEILCIGCLENRLKRKLSSEDFLDVPLNQLIRDKSFPSSPRLWERMNRRS